MSAAVIPHYRVIKRLGEGGMGEVFLAEDAKLRRLVALKTFRPEVEPHTRLGGAQERRGDGKALASLTKATDVFETRVKLGADDAFTRYYAACAYALKGQRDAARARREPELASLKNEPAFRQMIG